MVERPEGGLSPVAGAINGSPVAGSHRLVWIWHEEPAVSIDHLAMKETARPSPEAISFTPFLNTR